MSILFYAQGARVFYEKTTISAFSLYVALNVLKNENKVAFLNECRFSINHNDIQSHIKRNPPNK
jgi:hypothetical protein